MADTNLTPEQEYWQQNTNEVEQLEYFQEQANHTAEVEEKFAGNKRNAPETIAAKTTAAPVQRDFENNPPPAGEWQDTELNKTLESITGISSPNPVSALPLNPDTHQLQPTAQPADAGPLVPSLNPSDPPVGASE